ncbi:acetate--CoA ligase [Sphingomonas astaxanthinifaciens]|uniref:Acetate--CoA ligase n=1 Tax=Sphingomonas astaxanthinifaciens DSM 22298 TaxID=1123267 RepID=A0ABQ5ZBZ2_9SPHN|nr:acetate--CoA ligase [Sphingomonas astaxanthinifaciens]GLR48294.1 acetyl-coenzyme A synthetase [Sphingomonas astaxanthinifaciens DSM 22298]
MTPSELAALHEAHASDPHAFWLEQARRLDWDRFPTLSGDWSYAADDFHIRWYEDGILNLSANCLDRHLATRADQTALIFEPDTPGTGHAVTYAELHAETCRFANLLKECGVGKGDRVVLYLPMIPEAAAAMLACARIGAVHSVVFGGFSPESLAGRIDDCGARVVITADEGLRGGKHIPLKANVDAACDLSQGVETVIVVTRTGADVPMHEGRDLRWEDHRERLSPDCPAEPMAAEDPLFILYTSGSTGKPKGVVHTTGGYAVWIATTFDWVFEPRGDDLFWCTADIGWVTGHSYTLYGPLLHGVPTVMFDGVPTHPDVSRLWETIDRLGVTILYTAPTAIRALMREGDAPVTAFSRQSLRLLGTVGEPINPEAWRWYHDVVGDGRLPIVDTWWQTETGGILMTPLPGATSMKPGSATAPLPGIAPLLVDAEGREITGNDVSGNLCLAASWPGQVRTVWGDHRRFIETYFTTYPGRYFTGDGCRRDADGDYWITGRVDDVINVSGHRVGTAEVESALVAHALVAEAAVVAAPHDLKGQGIHAFVTLIAGEEGSPGLVAELNAEVRKHIGALAIPERIQFAPGLPKTRSGKIMRRILRKIAEGQLDQLGDTSTLADPGVVDQLVRDR